MGNVSFICATGDDGSFLDLFETNGETLFSDYHHLNKKIILAEGEYGHQIPQLGEKNNRDAITTIEQLENKLNEIIPDAIDILKESVSYTIGQITYLNFNDIKKELLTEQLIFDILFDQYLKDAEKMTLYGYARSMSEKLGVGINRQIAVSDAIRNKLKNGMKENCNRMKYSQLREEMVELGVDPDMYDKYYTPVAKDNIRKKKPKYIWDQMYYNRNLLTYRQYRRELKKDGNYQYDTIVDDFKEYDEFVKRLLPVENETPEKYFNMSMDYYCLESYKRVDFIFKLINAIPQNYIAEIDRNNFFVKRFHPCVLVISEMDGRLFFRRENKYYRPLLMIEDALLKQLQDSPEPAYELYAGRQLIYQLVRAKAYELFKYHAEYVIPEQSDYKDIKEFIKEKYNMFSYHQTNDVWETIKDKEWKQMDDETKRQIKQLVHNFFSINDALFWESSKRDYNIPKE